MVRKLKKAGNADDKRMAEAVRDSVEEIWQAGLGAFAKAQKEGEEMFAKLVQEGMAVQKRTQELAGEQFSGLSDTVAHMAESLGKQASGSWERLENVFEDRVAQTLRGLGVPTHDDIEALSARVGELHEMVNAMIVKREGGNAAVKKPAAKPAKKQGMASAAKKPPAKTKRAVKSAAGKGRNSAVSHT